MTNNKELYLKWMKNLFYIQCAALVGTALAALPFVGSWIGWINKIISIAILFAIFKLSPVSNRYRKAAIFMAIAVVLSIIISGESLGVLVYIVSICSFVATYQEYTGHSEMMAGVDEKLSRNWHSLFNWNLWGGVVVAGFGSVIVVLAGVALLLDGNLLAAIALALTGGFEVIIRIFYLIFLKRTYTAYENYEPSGEETVYEEI